VKLPASGERTSWLAEITIPHMKSKGKLEGRMVQLPVTKDAEVRPEVPRFKQELVTISGEQSFSLTIDVPRLVSHVPS
jgi:hypothetical protein